MEVLPNYLQLSVDQVNSEESLNPEVRTMLRTNTEVFKEPKGLPLHRNHEHRLVLLQGTKPISMRPYRYPYSQKNEIEKLVEELLRVGFIRHSPYSPHLFYWSKKHMEVGGYV